MSGATLPIQIRIARARHGSESTPGLTQQRMSRKTAGPHSHAYLCPVQMCRGVFPSTHLGNPPSPMESVRDAL